MKNKLFPAKFPAIVSAGRFFILNAIQLFYAICDFNENGDDAAQQKVA